MEKLIQEKLGMVGNIIAFSKSNYVKEKPNNLVVFNSNMIIDGEKVWFGDIDITESKKVLLKLSKKLNKTIYILYEMDGRFDNEDKPKIENYVVKLEPNGTINLNERLKEYYKI